MACFSQWNVIYYLSNKTLLLRHSFNSKRKDNCFQLLSGTLKLSKRSEDGRNIAKYSNKCWRKRFGIEEV